MNNHLVFKIEENRIHVLRMVQFETRGKSTEEILRRFVDLDPARFEGKTGVVFYDDVPPANGSDWVDFDLQFCSTTHLAEESKYLPFPCCHSLNWPGAGIQDSDNLLYDLLHNEEKYFHDKVFWSGAATHWTRVALVNLASKYKRILECNMMSWDRSDPSTPIPSDFVSIWDHRHYKYLVDCPGYGYSGRLKWLLASGRPVFVVDRSCVEHWHHGLVRWKHFIPVKEDLSDLLANYAFVEENPDLYAEISQEAKNFARANLPLDAQLRNCLSALPQHPRGKPARRQPKLEPLNYSVNYDEQDRFDLSIVVSVNQYNDVQLNGLKTCGFFNVGSYKVHLTLLVSPEAWVDRGNLISGWPEGFTISVFTSSNASPITKLNSFYVWQADHRINAKWHLRVDEDSMTDVAKLLDYANRTYDGLPVHIMTAPSFGGDVATPFANHFLLNNISVSAVAHENGCSLSSNSAMEKLYNDERARTFLEDACAYTRQSCDQPLALAMAIAEVPLAANPISHDRFACDRLSITGGELAHIRQVNWYNPLFPALTLALLRGERRAITDDDIDEMIDRPLVFGRCLGIPLATLTFSETGDIAGDHSENESKWMTEDHQLLLTRSDGSVTTIFHTMVVHGGTKWLVGPYLFEPTMHFVCIDGLAEPKVDINGIRALREQQN